MVLSDQPRTLSTSRSELQQRTNITSSLIRSVSPPELRRHVSSNTEPSTAQVEAGEKDINDHVKFFSEKLQQAPRPNLHEYPRINHSVWISLYEANLHNQGHHFVIHQHDHPVAGLHYDLRLQCNATSSISFAIMYGLPGDPNSRRLNRNATETRVHNLWNHLIETASHQTGSMLLWDTGEYEVLPYHETKCSQVTTDEDEPLELPTCNNDTQARQSGWDALNEPQKLHIAFKQRKVRLRLHGTRLPPGYTISLRLTHANYRSSQPRAPKKRKRAPARNPHPNKLHKGHDTDSSAEAEGTPAIPLIHRVSSSSESHTSSPRAPKQTLHTSCTSVDANASVDTNHASGTSISHMTQDHTVTQLPSTQFDSTANPHAEAIHTTSISVETSAEEVEARVHQTNTYPGATNDINSIYQRRWYLSLDRLNSGFVKSHVEGKARWIANGETGSGFEAFHVLGRDHERSVVTGRLAKDILADEGVVGYRPRGSWRAITQ